MGKLFLLYVNNSTTKEILKFSLTVVHIVKYTMAVTMVTYTEAWNIAFKTSKRL